MCQGRPGLARPFQSTGRHDRRNESVPFGESELDVEYWQAPGLLLLDAVLSLVGAMEAAGNQPRVFVCDLRAVPDLDARACRVLHALIGHCRRVRMALILSGVGPGARRALGAAGILDDLGPGNVFPHLRDAMPRAHLLMNAD